jgi:hypothetical protein
MVLQLKPMASQVRDLSLSLTVTNLSLDLTSVVQVLEVAEPGVIIPMLYSITSQQRSAKEEWIVALTLVMMALTIP